MVNNETRFHNDGRLLALPALLLCCCVQLHAAARTATTTVLNVGSSSASAGEVKEVVASVNTNKAPVFTGQVVFEDDTTGSACSLSFLSQPGCVALQTEQLTGAQASLLIRLGAGPHHLAARFLGTNNYAASLSSEQDVNVTGTATVALSSSGSPGNYTLTGTATATNFLAPAGSLSFVDRTNQSANLGTETLGAATLTQTFAPQVSYPAGVVPSSIAIGDFNGDGLPDLAVANVNGDTVSVLLSKGDGTFGTPKTYPVGSDPESVAVEDFNGDGVPDLAVAYLDGETVSVLLGIGNGTFATQVKYPVGSDPESVAIGDFNGDGVPDLAVANSGDKAVSVLLGIGDGTFATQKAYPVGSFPLSVVVGDFNGDGVPDLAVANFYDSTVSVLLGNRGGTFATQKTYPVGSGPESVAVGDFNGDGVPDLAVTNQEDLKIGVLLGKGDGTFGTQTLYTVGSVARSVAVGDFNGDGVPDLAVAHGDNAVSILLNQVTLSAAATVSNVAVYGAQSPHQVVAGYSGNQFYEAGTSPPVNLTDALQATYTGSVYNRSSKLYGITFTLKNTGSVTMNGPMELVLTGLPAGVTAQNNSGTYNVNPFWINPTSLAPGASATIQTLFSDPAGTAITFSIQTYAGGL